MLDIKTTAERAEFWRKGLAYALEHMGAVDEAKRVRDHDLPFAQWWASTADGEAMIAIATGLEAPPRLVLTAVRHCYGEVTKTGAACLDYVDQLLGGALPAPEKCAALRIAVAAELVALHPEAQPAVPVAPNMKALHLETTVPAELASASAISLLNATLEAIADERCPGCQSDHEQNYVRTTAMVLQILNTRRKPDERLPHSARLADQMRKHVPSQVLTSRVVNRAARGAAN